VIYVKAQNDPTYTEYHARGLVDMATEILMAVLLLEHSRKSDRKFNLTERFVTDTFHRVQMLAGKITCGDDNLINKYRPLLD